MHTWDGLELADELCSSGRSADLLIGSDYYWNFVTGETKRGKEGPIAVNSKLGCLLSGPVNESVDRSFITNSNLIIDRHNSSFQPSQDDVLADTLRGFWETESIGISEPSANADVKTEAFEINVKQNGDPYEVKLPWKEDCLPFYNGYHLCESRLQSLHQRLQTEPLLLLEYNNKIQDQLKTGIVEVVPPKDLKIDNNTT